MAITKIRLKNGGVRYRVRGLRGPDGRMAPQRSFRRLEDATRYERDLASARDRGDWIDPRGAKVRFSDFAEEWFSHKVVTRRTLEKIAGRLNKHILPEFGNILLGALKSGQIKEWRTRMIQGGLAPATVNSIVATLKEILQAAVLDELIRRNPAAGIKALAQRSEEEMRFLTPEQVTTLATAINPRFSALIFTAAYTGMRWGELAGLPISKVHSTRFSNQIRVDRSLVEFSDGTIEIGPTKTGKSRAINIPPFLTRSLEAHLAASFGWNGLVFTSAGQGNSDRYLRHSNFYRRHFKPALLEAGLDPGVRFHDLRHTAASWLIADGANPKQIMAILGHSTIRVTFDRYGHLFEGHDEELIQKLESRYRGNDASHDAAPTRVASP
jgi:integrase